MVRIALVLAIYAVKQSNAFARIAVFPLHRFDSASPSSSAISSPLNCTANCQHSSNTANIFARPILSVIGLGRRRSEEGVDDDVGGGEEFVGDCREVSRNETTSPSPSCTTIATNSSNNVVLVARAGAAPQQTPSTEPLSYLQSMAAGAVSRTMAQTLLHPANTYKTLLQLRQAPNAALGVQKGLNGSPQSKIAHHVLTKSIPLSRLLRGVDAQFLLSLPHGAFHFFVIDIVKHFLVKRLPAKWDFFADFTSSALSTVFCSIISTPQMVLTDRLMAGIYGSMKEAVTSIYRTEGVMGFYAGWWPALAQKIPSYALTWMFFQQLKKAYIEIADKRPSNEMNFILGAIAAAGSVSMMIPMDTIKTRLVVQTSSSQVSTMAYKGVTDCFWRILREEGVGAFYRSLPPRLLSVVPMIAIQVTNEW